MSPRYCGQSDKKTKRGDVIKTTANSNESGQSKRKQKTYLRLVAELLLLAVLLWFFIIVGGRALQKIAISQIAGLTNTKIETGLVHFDLKGSVLIENLVIRPRRQSEYDETILRAETVYARFGVGSLLLLRPRLKEISVKDFVFNAQQNLDTGQWNLAGLTIAPPKGGSGKIPVVHLERGTLQYSEVSEGVRKVTAQIPLDATLEPDEEREDCYGFVITTAKMAGGFGQSKLTGFCSPGRITITGGISSADIPAFERMWIIKAMAAELIYDKSNDYSLKLSIKDLLCIHRLIDDTTASEKLSLVERRGSFTALQRFFGRYRPQGQFDIRLEASGNLNQLAEGRVNGQLHCKEISVCDRKFLYPVEQIVGRIDFTERSVALNNLTGRHGDVELCFNGFSKDFGVKWQYQISITSDNMLLDSDLYSAFGQGAKKFWSAFSPAGVAAIDYHISRKSQTDKKRTLKVELLDVDARYRNFPYPLTNLAGSLLFESDTISISNVVSQSGGRQITINGEVRGRRSERPIYDISIKADNIALDPLLASALPAKQRRLFHQLEMAGVAGADVKVFTPEENVGPATFEAEVYFKDSSLKVSGAEMVITDISARTVFTPDLIRIEEFKGRHGGGSVELTGQIRPGQENEQTGYKLSVDAKENELNEGLFSVLPALLRKTVSESQARGKINYHADLNKSAGAGQIDYKIAVDCLGNSINFEKFPYPLRDVSGRMLIDNESIKLEQITATAADTVRVIPGSSTMRINGEINFAESAFGEGRFAFEADDIYLDERLGIALPENIHDFYAKLSPTGRFDLEDVNLRIFNAADGEEYIDFSGTARFKGCNFNSIPVVTQCDAQLRAVGLYKTDAWFCEGRVEFTAESLRVADKHLKGLKADINYNPDGQRWVADNLTAYCYGGRLGAKFELKKSQEEQLDYIFEACFDGIDLKQFLQDDKSYVTKLRAHEAASLDGRAKEDFNGRTTSGRMNGSLCVSGRMGDDNRRFGRCRLEITDMQVGKLSPLAKLLDVLKLSEPKDYAFEQMLVDSYIKGDRLFFEKIDLSGESVAFNGSGWMELRSKEVDLRLTARGRRLATAEPSIWQSLTEGLGQGVVRMEVGGSLYEPDVTTRTLPVIEDTLGLLGTKENKRK